MTPPGARAPRRPPEWLVASAVALVAAVVACIPRWREPLFYYWGDNFESFVPLWHHLGGELRQGRWTTMDPDGWMGGNYAAEAAYGIFNPVTLADAVLISFLDDLALATFLLMVQYLAVVALGVYLLVREYGGARGPAAAVAVAAPFAGFTLFYEAGNWSSGLMAYAWVLHFWWSARRYCRGRLNPVVPFLLGALAVTTGNPYGTVALLVVLLALAVELVARRAYRRVAGLVLVGLCVGTTTLLVFLPLMLSSSVTWRSVDPVDPQNSYLVPDAGDLLGMSTPSYLPTMTSWDGTVDHVPSTYLAWFLLPLLPWLPWGRLRGQWRQLVSLLVVGGVYLTMTQSPSYLWMFRWPLRMIEYAYVVALVVFALLLSAGLRTGNARRRATASVVIASYGGYLAWAGVPEQAGRHGVALGIVLALLALAAAAGRWLGRHGLVAVLVLGTAVVVGFQSTLYWWASDRNEPVGVLPDVATPHDLPRLRASAAAYQGTVLQLASGGAPIAEEDLLTGRLLFGNLHAAAGTTAVNRYSGIGYLAFVDETAMDYRGDVWSLPEGRLWRAAGEGVPAPLVDVMGVSTLVVQRTFLPEVASGSAPDGWRVALDDDTRRVLVRSEPLSHPGRVTWVTPGTDVAGVVSQQQREEVDVEAPEGGATIVMSRLAWPGYSAQVDGDTVDLVDGPAGLVAVEVPAGEHRLALTYRTPGLTAGAVAVAVGVLVSAGHGAAHAVDVRRRRIARSGG